MRSVLVPAAMCCLIACQTPSGGSPIRHDELATSARTKDAPAGAASHAPDRPPSHVAVETPGRDRCPWAAGKNAALWWQLDDSQQKALLSKHVRGKITVRRACQLSAMFAQVVVIRFDAKGTLGLVPLPPPWQPEPQGPACSSSAFFDEALPGIVPPCPAVEQDHFMDGEGNFVSRRLLREATGGWVLVVSFAG